jgi:hypothetical protein
MTNPPHKHSTRYEIAVDGRPRMNRDVKATAIATAKAINPRMAPRPFGSHTTDCFWEPSTVVTITGECPIMGLARGTKP